MMVRASAIRDLIGDFQRELLTAGTAIIHDKVVVIDPLSETDCVVITGSHNLGFKASYANDENMLIIKGAPQLAAAYAVHVLDVQDHYRYRAVLEERRRKLCWPAAPRPRLRPAMVFSTRMTAGRRLISMAARATSFAISPVDA